MILLDTSAVIWLHHGHRRGQRLARHFGQLYVSPVTLLELQLLSEAGRVRLRAGIAVRDLVDDDRWTMDNPSSVGWFERALEVAWTRDPFDRLLVAHASFRGWRLATGDGPVLDHLGPAATLEL